MEIELANLEWRTGKARIDQFEVISDVRIKRLLLVHQRIKEELRREPHYVSSVCLEVMKYMDSMKDMTTSRAPDTLSEYDENEDYSTKCCVIS